MDGAWLCVITESSWPIVRDNCLYGVPERAYKHISKVVPGDILIFYVISPVKSIVGIYDATSKVFTERKFSPWEGRLYPYRVHIKPLSEDLRELSKPIPLEAIVGNVSKIRYSKSLMGQSMVPLTQTDYEFIKSLIKKTID